jgi:hypothetical protein
MSNQPRQSTQIQDRRRCLGRVREWSNTISYMKRCIRTDCQVKDREIEFKNKMNHEAGIVLSLSEGSYFTS